VGLASRDQIVAVARRYLGTRFKHQGRVPGQALDCAGVVVCAARELGLGFYDVADYPRLPQGDALRRHLLSAGLAPIAPHRARPGDVLLMRFERDPQHLALMTDRGIIHAHLRLRGVVEHRLDDWWQGKIIAAFQFPGVET